MSSAQRSLLSSLLVTLCALCAVSCSAPDGDVEGSAVLGEDTTQRSDAADAVDAAQDTADAAQDAADLVQDAARDVTRDTRDDAQALDAAQDAADAAQDAADAAQDAADVAQDAADIAQDAADVAQDAADAAQDVQDPAIGVACAVGDRAGVCLLVGTCDGAREQLAGFCPGPADVQCCVPAEGGGGDEEAIGTPCAVQGVEGECLLVESCDGDRVTTPGYCPGSSRVRCCTPPLPDPGAACDPDARPLPNEGLVEPPGLGGCPAGMVRAGEVCIDRYEASLVEVLADGSEQGWSPYFNPGQREVRAVSLPGAVPQGYISGAQAAAACERAGKRLCTDAEWLRACQGPDGLTFPYGDAREDGVCNDARARHPAVEYFGSGEEWVFSRIDHPCLNQLPDGLARTGEHPGCVSAEGPLDMMGNLHEWTADPSGTFRGGFYVDTWRNGPGCLYRTTAHSTLHWDYSTGFRCCADP